MKTGALTRFTLSHRVKKYSISLHMLTTTCIIFNKSIKILYLFKQAVSTIAYSSLGLVHKKALTASMKGKGCFIIVYILVWLELCLCRREVLLFLYRCRVRLGLGQRSCGQGLSYCCLAISGIGRCVSCCL